MQHSPSTLAGAARLAGLALCLGLAHPAGAAAQDPSLPPAQALIDRHVQAIGGREAILKHSALTTEIEMQMGPMTLTMKSAMAAPNRVATTVELPGMGATRSGFDGTVAWQVSPVSGPMLLEGAALEQARERADFYGPLNYGEIYESMETVERTETYGSPCYRVKLVSHSGREAWQCFDVESGLAVAMGGVQESPMGSMDVTALLGEYREFGGVRMATRTTTTMMGQPVVMTVKSVTHGPVDPSVFDLPPEIRALVSAPPRP